MKNFWRNSKQFLRTKHIVPPYKVYNIGNNHPENLLDFVTILQEELVRAGVLPRDYDFESHKQLVPMQPGDVPVTYADTAPPRTGLRLQARHLAAGRVEKVRGVVQGILYALILPPLRRQNSPRADSIGWGGASTSPR